MMNSIVAGQSSHNFIANGYEVNTDGNQRTHAILRGSVNKHGNNVPNYHYEDLARVAYMYEKFGLANPAVIVDANHSNSGKQWDQQPRIVQEVLHSRSFLPRDQFSRQRHHDRKLYRRRQPADRKRRVRPIHHRPLPWMGKDRGITL